MKESKKYIELVYEVLENWYVKFAELTPRIILGLTVFFFFYFTSRFFSRLAVNLIKKYSDKSQNGENARILINVFRFLFLLAGTFISFEIMGFSGFILKFIGSLGVAGIIAGVALKDIVSSMFSGILVSVDKAFKVGDTVQISNITGRVVDIGFLTTKIIADDGRKYYVPNQQIFSAPFINFTDSRFRKVMIDLEVPNTTDLEKVRKVLLEEIKSCDFVLNPADADVILTNQKLGAYNLQARFNTAQGENITLAKSVILMKIKNRLDKEGIDTSAPIAP